mgnify:CR=1 FL=1
MSFAYWASSILSANQQSSGDIHIGQWHDGIPIFNAFEFIQVVTEDLNDNSYALANDIDFSHITASDWPQHKDIIFKGQIDGRNRSLSNINLTDYRGIFGILEGAVIKNLVIDQTIINYTLPDNYTSGILAGRLQGQNNIIENIRIRNSQGINQNVLSGALIGFASPLTGLGQAEIKNIKIENTELQGGISLADYGTGGLIGTVNNFNILIEDIYIEAKLLSTNAHSVGGVIGSVIGSSNVSINRAVVYANSEFRAQTNNTSVFVGGFVGRNTSSVLISHALFTGYMVSHVINPQRNSYTVRSGILRGSGNNLSFQNVYSSEITIFRRAQNPNILINSSNLYSKLTGQNPGFSNHVTNRSTLTQAWWSQNLNQITSNSSIWFYNENTNLFELNDE